MKAYWSTQIPEVNPVGRGNKFEHGELLKMNWLFARQNRDRSTANFSYIIFPYTPRFVKKIDEIIQPTTS